MTDSMKVKSQIIPGQVWRCKKDGRVVRVSSYPFAGNIYVTNTVSGVVSSINKNQLPKRYRKLSEDN